MPTFRYALLAVIVAALPIAAQQPQPPQAADDPFVWLEEVESPKSLDWVETHNRSTLAELQRLAVFDTLYKRVLGVLTNRDRIPDPQIYPGYIYNFWQDAEHQ